MYIILQGLVIPDRRRRIVPEVILVRRWVIGVLGIWKGEGLGKGLGQGRSVYKQLCMYIIIIIGMNVVDNLNSV
jgi:hypothetical protein